MFKEYRVLTANSAQQLSMSVSAMLLAGQGWQLLGTGGAVYTPLGVEYYQAIILHTLVPEPKDIPAPAETPSTEGEPSVQ